MACGVHLLLPRDQIVFLKHWDETRVIFSDVQIIRSGLRLNVTDIPHGGGLENFVRVIGVFAAMILWDAMSGELLVFG